MIGKPDPVGSSGAGRGSPRRAVLLASGFIVLMGTGALAGTLLTGSATPTSPAREPLIAPANAPRGQDSTGRLLPESWQRPTPGWLYVLDVNNLRQEGQVLLVDPSAAQVKGALRVGNDPAMALAPDGSRLYIVSTSGGKDSVSVFDTASGSVLTTFEVKYRAKDTLPPGTSSIALSSDGRRLYLSTLQIVSPGVDRYGVTTYDTADGRAIASTEVTGCGKSVLVPPSAAGHLDLVCPMAGAVQSLRPDVIGAAGASTLRLPLVADDRKDSNGNSLNLSRLAGAAASRDGSRLFNVTRNGRVVVVDSGSHKVIRTADMGLGADRWVSTTPVLAPDESSLFVPTGRVADRSSGQADQVLVIDTRSMKVTRTIKTSQQFWSLTASPDSAHLYAVDLHRQAIIDLDSQTGGQLGVVGGVGDTPSLALPVR